MKNWPFFKYTCVWRAGERSRRTCACTLHFFRLLSKTHLLGSDFEVWSPIHWKPSFIFNSESRKFNLFFRINNHCIRTHATYAIHLLLSQLVMFARSFHGYTDQAVVWNSGERSLKISTDFTKELLHFFLYSQIKFCSPSSIEHARKNEFAVSSIHQKQTQREYF